MKERIDLLNKECDRTLPDKFWEQIFDRCSEISVKREKIIINSGKVDTNTYSKRGIIRGENLSGEHVRVSAFAFPGSLFNSRLSFYASQPSYFQIVACTPCTLLKISKHNLLELTDTCSQIAVWFLHYAWFEQHLRNKGEDSA